MNHERWARARHIVTVILAVALAAIPTSVALGTDTQEHIAYLPLVLVPLPEVTPAFCTWVSDGDSIWVDLDGDGEEDAEIRYLLTQATARGECYSDEAKDRNIELVYRKTVGLERDVEDHDAHGRLLRYVWVEGMDVGATLIREGYARVEFIWYGNLSHLPWYLTCQDQALAESAGMWGACGYPTPTPYAE